MLGIDFQELCFRFEHMDVLAEPQRLKARIQKLLEDSNSSKSTPAELESDKERPGTAGKPSL